jgi:hypothetical protein
MDWMWDKLSYETSIHSIDVSSGRWRECKVNLYHSHN